MNKRITSGIFAVIFGCALAWADTQLSGPAIQQAPPPALSMPTVNPAASQPVMKPAVRTQFGFFKKLKLRQKFKKAQSEELKALKLRQQQDLKELKTSQKSLYNEWREKEKVARRAFFATHTGKALRDYQKDHLARRTAFLKIHENEKKERTQGFNARLESIQQDQAMKLKEFEEFLGRGEEPPARLWPSP